ncbi:MULTISPECIES: dTMP kinase [unclassified Polynucleobacter]|jgi:dTMP kinase|uniref:dTMP kinase n=1 Tax=unclassified Polynucleobacter TaxID=2640945 RepID=UPI00092C4B09|nr:MULTISPECIES: dTMP kinase [unclassified Polynucleobacter]MBU3563048.1 dTMP kinase [Polynucleobacter sp. Tro8-14-1]MEA9567676.1 dTMP kinase [Polynucleobacter sp. AP-Nickl1-40-C4]OJI05850.1 dTMP kinase [Polynucleobacter sp. MWH-Adler-W8]
MTSAQNGYFISFEGIDGAGKSTHVDAFRSLMQERYPNKEVVMTREPGGTSLGEQLRNLLLDAPMNLETEALLMFAARREHIAQLIEPALSAGKIVISDRFTDASFAYQGGGRGLSLSKLNELERWVQGRPDGSLLQPNLTILFDLPGEVAEARRSKVRAPDKFEKMDLDFFERVRQEYLRRAKDDLSRFHIVDATKTPEAIWDGLKLIQIAI